MAIPFYDNIDLSNNKIINLKTPENSNDAVNKKYVDDNTVIIETLIDTKISEARTDIDASVDGKISETESHIANLSTEVDSRIINNIVNNLYTDDTEKSLSAKQGLELNTKFDNLDTKVRVINDFINLDESIPDDRGNILNFPYKMGLIPIQLSENLEELEYKINLFRWLETDDIVFDVKGHIVIDDVIYYVNTKDIALTNYDMKTATLNIEFSEDMLEKVVGKTLYLIVQYYKVMEDDIVEDVLNEEGGED